MTVLVIELPLPAPGKPRMTRRDKWRQRPCVVEYRAWADALRDAAGSLPPPERILSLDWLAEFTTPPSWSKKKRAALLGELHRGKPDRDNIDKAILDALFPDGDSAIAAGALKKVWSDRDHLTITIQVGPG